MFALILTVKNLHMGVGRVGIKNISESLKLEKQGSQSEAHNLKVALLFKS